MHLEIQNILQTSKETACIQKYSHRSFVFYNTSSLLPASWFFFSRPCFWGAPSLPNPPLSLVEKVRCTFTITEAQHLSYNLYKYPKTLYSGCCSNNVILNRCMFKTLYTHLHTLVPIPFVFRHTCITKLSWTSKIALLLFICCTQVRHIGGGRGMLIHREGGEAAMHARDVLQSSPTSPEHRHKVLKPCSYIKPDITICLFGAASRGREGRTLSSCSPVGEARSKER